MPDITIGRLRGGYCVYWEEVGRRRRHQLKARTPQEAESEARDIYLSKQNRRQALTVADVWASYCDHLGDKPTAKTMGYTGKAVLAHFGHLRPDQISAEDCRSYAEQREQIGRKVGAIHTELGHLRSALTWAAKDKLIDAAPHIERPPKPDSAVVPLSDDQMRLLIASCGAFHIRLAVILLYATGARVAAILDRKWKHIDFDRGVINLRLDDGVKRKGRAIVPMNRMARAALQTAYDARINEYVVEYKGGPVKNIRKGFEAASRRAGLAPLKIHQIRHSAAVKMLSSGVPLEKVSQYLGHSDTRVTAQIYARFLPEHLSDAADALDISRFNEPEDTSQNIVFVRNYRRKTER